jgi:hypothetical protein
MNLLESARGFFRSKPTVSVSEKAYSSREMVDFVMGIMPDEYKEAFTRADIELALDDRGWLVPGRQWTAADLDAQTRTTLVAKARLYWLRDPLMKQAVRLWTDYALGTGVSWDSKDEDVKNRCDAFAKNRRNKTIMNSEGMRRSSKKLLIDGELFFAIFDADKDDDPKTIRRIDCLQISDIICDPDDEEHVLGYRRLTAQDKVLYYPDWRNDDEDNDLLLEQPDPSSKGKISSAKPDQRIENCKVYHLPFDTLLKRGNGLLSCNLDWSKEHRRFMEARVAIQQALAKFAWKGKVQGGQGIINQLQNKLSSTYTTAGMTQVERHPQTAPGGTWLENKGIDLAPMPRATGAGDARSDGDQLKLMVSAGTGIMLHYFGDPSTGNLATAEAMELPMLKMFQSYQTFWRDAYRDIFSIAMDEDPDEPDEINISTPPILLDDLRKIGQFMGTVAGVFPEIACPAVLKSLLNSLNVDNLDEVMEDIENKRGELALQDQQSKAHALQLARAQAAGNDPNDPNVNQSDPKAPAVPGGDAAPDNGDLGYGSTESARQTKALNRLAKAMEEVTR